jgi:SAM-dependent methyltransferase
MIARLFAKLLARLGDFLPLPQLELMLERAIEKRSANLSPDEALRFLFRLDAALYSLQGPLAVAYNGGVHTKHRHTAYHDFFVNRIKKGERVLDVGCGIGVVAYDLARAGAIVDGVDLNESSIAEAKRRFTHHNLHFAVQDALKLEVKKAYDIVLLSNVLEHLHGRPKFLKEVRKLTGAKRFFIRVPLFERDWRVPLKKELGVEWRLDPDHKTEYTLDSFAEDAKSSGLDVTHLEVRWGEIWAELRAE